MAAITELSINVSGNKSSLNQPLYLYLGDGDITLLMSINRVNIVMGTYNTVNSVINEFNTKWAKICILKPDGTLITYDKCEVLKEKIVFIIKKELIDEIGEAGKYDLQIHLYDGSGDDSNRFTIPPITFEVLKPICDIGHYNGLSVAITGTSHVNACAASDDSNEVLTTAFSEEEYTKNTWYTGDLISASKLNNIENGIYQNKEQIYRINEEKANKTDIITMESIGKDVKEAMNGSVLSDWYYPTIIKGTELGTNGVPNSYSEDNYELFYDWILNPLVEDYSDYITKTILGKDSSNTYNIYCYEFIPEKYDRTIIILSNVHGNEYTSFYGLCRFVDELCRNYKTDSNLYFLRNKVKISIIPIVNPWGFINSNRRNFNEVDLNRNSSYRWEEYTSVKGQVGGVYYKGSEAFSEIESQYVKNLVERLAETDNLVGFIDLHTINSIEAEKILYYPRFAKNALSELYEVLEKFDSETENNRVIYASSSVPTFSNWAVHKFGINGCNPEWNNKVYGTSRGDFLMRKHVEWISNIIIAISKSNRKAKVNISEPFIHTLIWNRDESLTGEDENKISNLGYRVLKSDNYNNFEPSKYNIEIDRESIVTFNGHVRVYAQSDCTLYLDPLVYQQYSPEQNYTLLEKECRFTEIVTLKAGTEMYIPITAVLQGFHTNYNDENSSRAALVHFRLRAKTNVANAVYITGYKVNILITPSDLGKSVNVSKLNNTNIYETVYPLRISDEIED